MEANPMVDVLGCNAYYFSDNPEKTINTSRFPQGHEEIYQMFHKGENALLHATAFVRAKVYKRYRYQAIFPGEDYELFARMIKDGCVFHNLPIALYGVRVHVKSSTSMLKYEQIAQTFRFRDRIFGTRSAAWKVWVYYWHLATYRRYQQLHPDLLSYFWLVLSISMYPQKILKRFISVETLSEEQQHQ